ncbi:DUF669 domain-containing protein [Peptococcus simiae]|uniref:DUF669 domain-containing protein n=1 Tax=Peptococcus simiae TaxID=1643805 RepID=A0ABW9H158_9FIRM
MSYNNNLNTGADLGQALDWEGYIEKDDSFILLPEGIYTFKVLSLERGYFNGSEKMPPCPRATVQIQVVDPASKTPVELNESLLLNTKMEWKLSQFFSSIGQKKPGERIQMNWLIVPGATGKAEIHQREYTNQNGEKRTTNAVKNFLPAIEPTQQGPVQGQAAPPQAQAYQQPTGQDQQATGPVQQQMTNYTPGSF